MSNENQTDQPMNSPEKAQEQAIVTADESKEQEQNDTEATNNPLKDLSAQMKVVLESNDQPELKSPDLETKPENAENPGNNDDNVPNKRESEENNNQTDDSIEQQLNKNENDPDIKDKSDINTKENEEDGKNDQNEKESDTTTIKNEQSRKEGNDTDSEDQKDETSDILSMSGNSKRSNDDSKHNIENKEIADNHYVDETNNQDTIDNQGQERSNELENNDESNEAMSSIKDRENNDQDGNNSGQLQGGEDENSQAVNVNIPEDNQLDNLMQNFAIKMIVNGEDDNEIDQQANKGLGENMNEELDKTEVDISEQHSRINSSRDNETDSHFTQTETQTEESSTLNGLQIDNNTNGDILITAIDSPRQRDLPPDSPSQSQEADTQDSPNLPPLATNRLESHYTEEELNKAIELFLKKKQMPPPEMREDILKLARKNGVTATLNEDYVTAEEMDHVVDVMTECLNNDNVSYEVESTTKYLEQRLEQAQLSQKELEKYYDELITQQKEQEQNRKDILRQQHENELRNFEDRWNRPEAMIPYSKPSVQLLQIRRMQKSYAISHHFSEARQMKVKGDNLQKMETAIAQKKASEAMKIEYEQLVEKQQREVECGELNWKRKLETLEAERDKALEANNNLKKQLSNKITSPKRPKKPHVMLPIVSRDVNSSREPAKGLYSYRTRSRFADYKKGSDGNKLDVKLGDVRSIIRPKTACGSPRKKRT